MGQACINASCIEYDEDKAVELFEEGVECFEMVLKSDPENERVKHQLEILSQ